MTADAAVAVDRPVTADAAVAVGLPISAAAGAAGQSGTGTASYSYRNPETGFYALVNDAAGLLSDEEEEQLLQDMIPVTGHCNALFRSDYGRFYSTMDFAGAVYKAEFGQESGVLFLIDMYNRELTLYAGGDAYRSITRGKARSITDNVYSYALKGDYYSCAATAFAQADAVLRGARIAQPMKYLCSLLIALCTAFLLTYLFVSRAAKAVKPSREELLRSIGAVFRLQNPRAQSGKTTRVHSPRVVVTGGRGGSGGRSGGGFGGGFSGGGGSHRF